MARPRDAMNDALVSLNVLNASFMAAHDTLDAGDQRWTMTVFVSV